MSSDASPALAVPQAVRALKRSSSCTLCDDRGRRHAAEPPLARPTAPKTKPIHEDAKFNHADAISGGYDHWAPAQLLGEGSFAKVKLVRGAASDKIAVVKTTSIINRSKPRAALFSLREALALVHLPQHPNIPHLLDFSATPKETHLILELAPGEELFSYVNSSELGRLDEQETRKIVRGILEALRHAHDNGVLHRDVKLDNVFWDPETEQVSLLDFGLATFFDGSSTLDEAVGCINYASPQLLRLTNTGVPYPAAHGWSDLWALGILMHGLLSGFFPFRAEEPIELEREIRTTWMNASEIEGVPSGEIGRECRRFLHAVLDPANEGRLTAADMLAHPWLSDSDGPLPPVEKATAPLPRLPMATKDHRRVARLAADQLQARLPEHRRRMAREILGDDVASLASTLPIIRTPSPAVSEATAMELDEPEPTPAQVQLGGTSLFATFKSASSSFSSLKSTASTDSKKSAVRRWFAKLSGRQ